MPMVFSQINDDWHQHRESLLLVRLENIQEVVIFEEAHRSVSNLKMDASDTFHYPLEQAWNQVLNFVNFADF